MKTMTEKRPKWAEAYQRKRPSDYDQFIKVAGMKHGDALEALGLMIAFDRKAHLNILELGTGTGLLTKQVLESFPRAHVTGIDGALPMLAIARDRLAPFGRRFEAVYSSFEDYAFEKVPQSSIDLVVSSFALHHMDHGGYPAFFSKLRRLLKPGGQLLVADLVRSASEVVWRQYMDIWVEVRTRQMKEMQGITAAKEEVWREHERNMKEEGDNPAPVPELLRWLSEAGFKHVDCHWKHFCVAVYGGTK